MILNDKRILAAIEAGTIEITPFKRENLGSNSYDLTLQPKILRFAGEVFIPKEDQSYLWRDVLMTDGEFMLYPDECYLAATNEIVYAKDCVPMLDGKSSIGRNFISIHQTAGVGDLGFKGTWTLEITVAKPTILYANMPIAQVTFIQSEEPERDYVIKGGRYNGQDLPQTSRMYRL